MLKKLAPLFILLLITGCKDPYGASAKAGADIATGIAQGMSTVNQLAMRGAITNTEAINVLGYLEFANIGDKAFIACVQTAHTNGDKPGTYTACAATFNTALNNPQELSLVHVSEGTASSTIANIIDGLTAGVALVEASIGGA